MPAWARYGLLAAVVLAAVHVGLVAGHYVVGSFDDDGHYLALAKAFAHGKGYVDTSIPGSPVETLYPPGYPLLIAPLVWLFGSALWPLRVLSALAFLGCFPLLDRLLRRHPVSHGVRVATLLLFALSPTAATFGSEVMPEAVFLLVLLAVLLALPPWEQGSVLSWRGAVVALGAPYLFLLKTAGLPMLVGVLAWLLLRRRWRHLLAATVASVAMLLPLVLVRVTSGPVVGSRYQDEYALAGPFLHAVWNGAHLYVTYAIPATLVPTGGAGLDGHLVLVDAVLWVLRYSAALLVVVGWVSWMRRRLDVTALITVLYMAETVPFAFINQRRVVLMLPLVVAWYALGWSRVLAACRAWAPARARGSLRYAAAVPVVLVFSLLAWQLPRDYLLLRGESTPAARGSGYVAALRDLTPAGWSVAAAYQWTTAELTGRTATRVAHFTTRCAPGQSSDLAALHGKLATAHVATVLDAWAKWPHNIDNPCLLATLSVAPWAVPVFHGTDASTVFVLVGPGTPRPSDRVVLDVGSPAQSEASLPAGTQVTELSVVVPAEGPAPSLEVRDHGEWVRLPASITEASPRLLHVRLSRPMAADAVRVTGAADGPLHDLVVLGRPA
jgi:4-amino-4-deoxy-L-arabinose transferase-like glycosyltransferase